MLQNYLKVALRNLQRQRLITGINILGLAIGICCCTLISLFVWNELQYDRHFEKAARIYRVNSDINYGGKHEVYAVAQAPLAKALREEVPGVETACRFRSYGGWSVRKEDVTQNINEDAVIWADQEVLDVFSFQLLSGDKKGLLTEPNTLVLSHSAAVRHFGALDPVGKTLILNNESRYKVTGVYADLPQATHFHFDFLLSMKGLKEAEDGIWLSHNFNTYVVVKPGSSVADVERNLNATFRKYVGPQAKAILGVTLEDIEAKGNWARYKLFPMTGIHLHSDIVGEFEPNGSMTYVWIFGAIALFILLIACINFMNLATARSANRAREVGMRKVLGSVKKQLIGQFLTEAILMSGIAFLIAGILGSLAMPWFNQLTTKTLSMPYDSPRFWGLMAAGTVLVGLLAGSYPSFYLSAFKPIDVLKGKLATGLSGHAGMRNGLVVFQFAISILLIIGTTVIRNQLNFIQSKRLGYDKEHVFILNNVGSLGEKYEGFKNRLQGMPEVQSLTATCYLPSGSCRDEETIRVEGAPAENASVAIQRWQTDYDYLSTLSMAMTQGRFFSKDFATDSTAIVLNETAVKQFGFDQPIGKRLVLFTDQTLQKTRTLSVIGVIRDFNFESLHNRIDPLCMVLDNGTWGTWALRLKSGTDIAAFIDKLKGRWASLSPAEPFSYDFMDAQFAQVYRSEQRLGTILNVFGALAIFIACLGLMALAAFTAERRAKEIGVRKVLGASTANVIGLLSGDFLKLVLVSMLIASPIAYYFMEKWLQDFAYHTEIGWPVFAIAGLIALGIAFLTVSFQSIKAALANPVNSLRNE